MIPLRTAVATAWIINCKLTNCTLIFHGGDCARSETQFTIGRIQTHGQLAPPATLVNIGPFCMPARHVIVFCSEQSLGRKGVLK
jgi:hypothetical protein